MKKLTTIATLVLLLPLLVQAGEWILAIKPTASIHDKLLVHTYLNNHNGTNEWTVADYHLETYAKPNGAQRDFTSFWKWQLPTATLANWNSDVIDKLDDANSVVIASIVVSYTDDIANAGWTNCVAGPTDE